MDESGRGVSFYRIRRMKFLFHFLLILIVISGSSDTAFAHGSVTPEDDNCIIRIGFYKAHFKIYLPQTEGHEQYCEDIPKIGETVFIMEYEHSGLGDVPVDFRIIRNTTGQGIFTVLEDIESVDNIDAITVIHQDATIQPDVFMVIYNFEEQGEFVGIIKVLNPDNGQLYTAVFPFEVGFSGFGWWPWFVLIAISIQLIYLWMGGWFDRWRRMRLRRRL